MDAMKRFEEKLKRAAVMQQMVKRLLISY